MRSRGPGLPTIMAAVTAAVVTVGIVVSAVAGHHGVRREEATRDRATAARSEVSHARAVLRTWDHRRSAAWAGGDPAALRALYVSGSVTGHRDVRMLEAYRERGLRVTGMNRQVLRFRVRSAGPRRLALLVTDHLVDARVVGHGVAYAVPEGPPVTLRVLLTRDAKQWRVVEVERPQPAR